MPEDRLDLNNMCLDEYEKNTGDSDVYYKRAIGEFPEMECSKALAKILVNYVKQKQSVLDVGCAAGGGAFDFCREANVNINYTGIDISETLINIAEELHPEGEFFVYDVMK